MLDGVNTIRGGETIEGEAMAIEEIHKSIFGVPAGSFTWSTPSELLKMADFLLNGNTGVLSDNLRIQMTSPQVNMNVVIPMNYGYGLFIDDGIATNSGWYPVQRWEHGGNTLAYSSEFWVLPNENIAVSILSSGLNTDFTDTMLAALRSVITLPVLQILPLKPVATELFHGHLGRYDGDFGLVEVSLANGQLHIDLPLYDEMGIEYQPTLQAIAGSNFNAYVDGETIDLTFIPDVVGENSIYIRNREFVGIRNDNAASFGLSRPLLELQLPGLVPKRIETRLPQ